MFVGTIWNALGDYENLDLYPVEVVQHWAEPPTPANANLDMFQGGTSLSAYENHGTSLYGVDSGKLYCPLCGEPIKAVELHD